MSRGHEIEECLNLSKFPAAEREIGSPRNTLHLIGPPGADNRTGYARLAQYPGDSDFTWRASVVVPNGSQQPYEFQVAGNLRFLKIAMPLPPIIDGQGGDALARHGASQ